jgi:hypothetical protein
MPGKISSNLRLWKRQYFNSVQNKKLMSHSKGRHTEGALFLPSPFVLIQTSNWLDVGLSCFTQSTDPHANLTQKHTHRHPQDHVWPHVWGSHAPVKWYMKLTTTGLPLINLGSICISLNRTLKSSLIFKWRQW